MLNWLARKREYREAVSAGAEELVLAHGDGAYKVAREAMRLARREGSPHLEKYMAKVALEVARRDGREVGVDTATRYLPS